MNIHQLLRDRTPVAAPAVRNEKPNKPQKWQAIAASVQKNPDLLNPDRTYAPQLIRALDAWTMSQGRNVVVAILDTGLDVRNPEFAGRIVGGANFYDPYASTYDDDNGHGTHVAGIVGAAIDNFVGAAGIAPQCKIMPVKVLNHRKEGTWGTVAAGIYHAVDNGAKIINLSLGSPAKSPTVEEAVNYAYKNNVLVIAAAGNSSTSTPFYPSAYDNVLAVSASTEYDQPWESTNYGSHIDVAAPGHSIWSTYLNNDWRWLSGTSMAAPHVAGLAALVYAKNPRLSVRQLRKCIVDNTVDIGQRGFDIRFGHGRIDAYKALQSSGGTRRRRRRRTSTASSFG